MDGFKEEIRDYTRNSTIRHERETTRVQTSLQRSSISFGERISVNRFVDSLSQPNDV